MSKISTGYITSSFQNYSLENTLPYEISAVQSKINHFIKFIWGQHHHWNFLPSLYSTCTTVYHLQQNRTGSDPRAPLKKFFWSNPYEIELMVTSLIEMTELPNFGHMITSTI